MHPLRKALDGALAHQAMGDNASYEEPINDATWAVLEERGIIQRFESGEPNAFEDALQFVHDARRTHLGARPDHERRRRRPASRSGRSLGDQPSARAYTAVALSHLFALDAPMRDCRANHGTAQSRPDQFGLCAFRREHLHDRLIDPEQVGDWVETRAAQEGRATVVRIRRSRDAESGWRLETLAYTRKDSQWAHHIPVRLGGVLDRLRRVSKALAEFYGWFEAQATAFVLSGSVPVVPMIRMTIRRRVPLSTRSRIVLDVHPLCTPQEVADTFSKARAEEYGRLRRLSPKHARLAMFAAEQPEGRPWIEQLREWNRLCSREGYVHGERGEAFGQNWTYPAARAGSTSFARDARLALRRLTELTS